MGQHESTHIANAYPETIYAKVSTEQFYATNVKNSSSAEISGGAEGVEGSVSGSTSKEESGDWRKLAPGFQQIHHGSWLKFENFDATAYEREQLSSADGVFITIRTENGDFICKNLTRLKDSSLIVDRGGNIVDQKYGESPFVDIYGRNHRNL